jgi:hypothetical protein
MRKRQGGRRAEQKPARGARKPRRSQPEAPQSGRGVDKTEHRLTELEISGSAFRGGGRDILEQDRSDRDSGRPLQLEQDVETETGPRRRADRSGVEEGAG